MSRLKDISASYGKELLKQTDPYEYYIKYVDEELKGDYENVPFNLIHESTVREYDYGDYVLYENAGGYSSEAERRYLIAKARKLDSELIFSDIDFLDKNNKKHTPFFKPDYDADTYEAFDYISDFYAVKKELNNTSIQKLTKISHVTKVLYHCIIEDSEKIQSDIESINEIYSERYITPDYYADNSITEDTISVIIPSKDNPNLLDRCLTGIKKAKVKSKININKPLEIHIIDNGSSQENKDKITNVIKNLSDDVCLSITYSYEPGEFNFSKMCNKGAKESSADYLLFLNDDIEITDDEFLVKLLYYARKPHAGAAGCKLLYPDGNKIQHTGITDLKYAGPSHKLSTFPDDKSLYFGRNRGVHNTLAVTGACLMVSSDKFFKTGGFCDKMKVGYNDVDLCVSLYENGFHNIVNNDLSLIHHESVTRGADSASVERLSRLKEERDLLYERHPFLKEKGDPYYNPTLAGDFLDYRVNVIPDFERRDYRSAEAVVHKKYTLSRNLYFNIESVETGIDPETLKEYAEIKGWALLNKKNNAFYDIYVTAASYVFTTAPVYRPDLPQVFPQAKNCELSGFLARIDLDKLKNTGELQDLRFGVILLNRLTKRIFYGQCKHEQGDSRIL